MLKILATVAAAFGALMVYETEANFPPHATIIHRAIPVVVYVVVVLVLTAIAKARENAKASRRNSDRATRYSRGERYPYPRRGR